MITIQVEGIEALQRRLRSMPSVLNKGIANGINRTARAIEQHELVEMERTIDRPTPFTLAGVRVSEARPKPDANAIIYIQPIQARYLRMTIEGGVIPVNLTPIVKNVRLNQYGNIPGKRKGLEGIKGKAGTKFIGEIRGVYGVWQRYGRGGNKLKLLVRVERNARRKKRFDFYGVGQRVANQRLTRDVIDAIRAAIR